ncbi:MAG: LysM peptidoglycan-binding domain-containing protein, partial [Bacilli bacterium]|nr:LysM peptidoglycan-binding domain-containing protein [Bacilli bacterium]
IAKQYNTSVSEILNLNQLNSSSLQIGQVLKIPSQDLIYTVSKGDSLYSISKKFQTSVDSIKNKNGLNDNTLQIGQVLKI